MLKDKIKKLNWKNFVVFLFIVLLFYFSQPTILHIVIGSLFIFVGESIRLWATGHLIKNKRMTKTGPYAYLKNPLYLGTLFIGVGFCIIANNIYFLIIGLAIFFIYYMPYKNRVEGNRLKEIYGDEFLKYSRQVSSLIPRIRPYKDRDLSIKWNSKLVFENSEHETLLVALIGIFAMVVKFLLF